MREIVHVVEYLPDAPHAGAVVKDGIAYELVEWLRTQGPERILAARLGYYSLTRGCASPEDVVASLWPGRLRAAVPEEQAQEKKTAGDGGTRPRPDQPSNAVPTRQRRSHVPGGHNNS